MSYVTSSSAIRSRHTGLQFSRTVTRSRGAGGNSGPSARGRGFIRAFHLDAEGLETMVHHQGGDDAGAFPSGGDYLDVVGHPEFVREGEALAVFEAAASEPDLRRQQPGLAAPGLKLEK